MKKFNPLFILSLFGLVLTSCKGTKHYDEKEYMLDLAWDTTEDFKVLQLGDIHFSQSDYFEQHFEVMSRTIKAADPDLIVLNGDAFTYADKHVVDKLFSFINDKQIPWTFTYGNHDDQGYFRDTYLQRLLDGDTYDKCVFKNIEDDDVTGRSNLVINLKNSTKVEYQIFLMESHNYNFDTFEYDVIKNDQIDWYKRMVNYSTLNYGAGKVIPSSLYMHIQLPEFNKAYEETKEHPEMLLLGDMEEFGGAASKDNGFFDVIKELGSTKSIHCAHDHANDSVVDYEGIYLCFGVHATNRIYNDENWAKIGGQVLTIHKEDKSISLRNYYTSYDSDEVNVVDQKEAQK